MNHRSASYARLGLLNGALIGLALALGIWLRQVVALAQVPAPLSYPSIVTAVLLLTATGAVAGWLSARLQKSWATFLIWLGAAVLMAVLAGIYSSAIRTVVVWLIDPRFFGLPVYARQAGGVGGFLLVGLFIVLALIVLALVESERLPGIHSERNDAGRLTATGWWRLLLPLPLVAAAGLVTGVLYGDRLTPRALPLVHEAISTALTYEGDLFALGRREGLNYSALDGVRDQLGETYTLAIADVDAEAGLTTVAAHFDNGAWIYCRLIFDQLNFCYDAAPPYTEGFADLIAGREAPEDCRNCRPVANEAWQAWLAERRALLGPQPDITFVAQRGSYVLMRAAAAEESYAIECWFSGVNPVQLESCEEVD